MATQQVIRITAVQIAALQAKGAMGKIEESLLQLAGEIKGRSQGRPVLLRLDFPGGDIGGIELRCARPRLGWWLRLLWHWTVPVPLWEGE